MNSLETAYFNETRSCATPKSICTAAVRAILLTLELREFSF
jgi:hypothetical protein